MYSNHLHFFHLRSNIDIQKNKLSELDPSYQRMQFLINMLQIFYFFNIQLFISNIQPGQTQLVKTIYLLCGGILIFLNITIYLHWFTKHDCFSEKIVPLRLLRKGNKRKKEIRRLMF